MVKNVTIQFKVQQKVIKPNAKAQDKSKQLLLINFLFFFSNFYHFEITISLKCQALFIIIIRTETDFKQKLLFLQCSVNKFSGAN